MKKGFVIVSVGILLVLFGCISTVGFLHAKTEDVINKNFYLLGHYYSVIEYNSEFNDEGFNAQIDGKDLNDYVVVNSTLNTRKIGNYEIHYTLNYKNYTKTITRYVKVVDNKPPTLNIKCDDDVYVSNGEEFKKCEYEATDEYEGNLYDRVLVTSDVDTRENGDYKITYLVSDSSNNSTSKVINVHVRNKFDITYIKIIISEQRLYYYVNNKVVLETPVTTGKNNYTKTGDFKIRNKVRDTTLKGPDYESKVKYWMAYNGNSFGIHDASWRSRFGTMDYKWNGSHGCVNVPTKAMEELFYMVEVGTPVYIRN